MGSGESAGEVRSESSLKTTEGVRLQRDPSADDDDDDAYLDCASGADDEGFPLRQLSSIQVELLWVGLHDAWPSLRNVTFIGSDVSVSNRTFSPAPSQVGSKDIDGLIEVLQVPVDGAQAVPQLIGCPVYFLFGGSAPFLQQLHPSEVEALSSVHRLLHLPKAQTHLAQVSLRGNCSLQPEETLFLHQRQEEPDVVV